MAEAPRPRPAEYYNPRPLILGICFFWGVAMGFCLFYFSPPKQMTRVVVDDPVTGDLPASPETEEERRKRGLPTISPVTPTLEPDVPHRPGLETMDLEPLFPVLTTEGGLTGRTARPLAQHGQRRPSTAVQPPSTRPPMTTPPPIPDLMP